MPGGTRACGGLSLSRRALCHCVAVCARPRAPRRSLRAAGLGLCGLGTVYSLAHPIGHCVVAVAVSGCALCVRSADARRAVG